MRRRARPVKRPTRFPSFGALALSRPNECTRNRKWSTRGASCIPNSLSELTTFPNPWSYLAAHVRQPGRADERLRHLFHEFFIEPTIEEIVRRAMVLRQRDKERNPEETEIEPNQ